MNDEDQVVTVVPTTDNDNGGTSIPSSSSCSTRWKNEWSQQTLFFDLSDDTKIIDIPSSFCMAPSSSSSSVSRSNSKDRIKIIIAKFICCAWTVATFIQAIVDAKYKSYWLAFLTNWSLLFAVFYILCSFTVTIVPSTSSLVSMTGSTTMATTSIANDDNDNNNDKDKHNHKEQHNSQDENSFTRPTDKLPLLIKITWISFALAGTFQCITTVLYWVLVYDGEVIEYLNIMQHGIVNILVLIDGLLFNKVPVRMKHLIVILVSSGCWVLWSIIHDISSLSNPHGGDSSSEVEDSQDDDAIYTSIRWNHEPISAVILCLIVLFIVEPLFLTLIWTASLRNRRYKIQT